MSLDSTCFATGNNLKYLCCILNSNVGHYLLKDAPKTGTGDLLISVQAVEPIKIPKPSISELEFEKCLEAQLKTETFDISNQINRMVYRLYGLSEDEISYVEDFVTQFQ